MLAIEQQLAFMGDVRVACIGDVMLDRFLYGSVERISPEAPTPVIHVHREDMMPGGAGNVVRNVGALGGSYIVVSVVGADASGRTLHRLFEGCRSSRSTLIRDKGRPTTQKMRFVSERYKSHLLRADQESMQAISGDVEKRTIQAALSAVHDADVTIVSDYRKGVVTPHLVRAVIAEAKRLAKPVIIDPKGEDYEMYRGASVLTPNKGELSRALGRAVSTTQDVVDGARSLIGKIDAEAVLVTRSEEGMSLIEANGKVTHIPSFATRVVDVSGAGDTVVATFSMMVALGADLETAARVANAAAGVVVGRPGTATLSMPELRQACLPGTEAYATKVVRDLAQAGDLLQEWRSRNLRIGFTNGCFDLIHPGHIHLLSQARAACDRLVVGLNSDRSVRGLKGPTRPVQNEMARARVLAAFEAVHLVVIFEQATPEQLIMNLGPDVLVKGGDYTLDTIVGADFVQARGGEVVIVDLVPGESSSNILARSAAPTGRELIVDPVPVLGSSL